MPKNSLNHFIKEIRQSWGPLNSSRGSRYRELMEALITNSRTEPWMQELLSRRLETTELYRDPEYGFILLAHIETQGLKRPPHDHGDCWVIYGVAEGKMRMSTYGLYAQDGNEPPIRREAYDLAPGQTRIYLPGDIHDTECLAPTTLMFRFTSCDLKNEARNGRLHRYESQFE